LDEKNIGRDNQDSGSPTTNSYKIQCWEEVSMDFITGLPKSEGKIAIMVVLD
jgi:hypothetical protein